jgi:hypothetical protein
MALEALGMARMDRKRDLRNLEPRERAKLQVALTGPEKRIMEQLVNQLLSYHNGSGWRYGNFKSTDKRSGQTTSVNWDTLDGYGIRDLSATQFALLGLKSAIRCRIKIPKDYFQKTIPFILEQQEEEGPQVVRKSGDDDPNTERRDRHATYVPDPRDRARGFAYIRGCQGHEGATSGSMTTAGIASLILCKSELIGTAWMRQDRGVRARQLNQAIWDGLAWLDHNWEIYQNFGYPMNQHYHYYLYGLERVGVLGELHWIGRHHWYSAGAEVLLKTQELTGEWTSGGTPKKERAVPDTCFALLFLKKATVPVGPVLTRDE